VAINVSPEQARVANQTARSADVAADIAPPTPAAVAPGMFAFVAAAVAAKQACAGAAGKSLEARMVETDNRTDNAVVGYTDMNSSNRQSLTLI